MPADRYTRFMLTVIAGALVYLCAVLGPMPGVGAVAQVPPIVRPGDPTGPVPVVVVDWQTRVPVAVELPSPTRVEVENPVRIAGTVPVTTERSTGRADRVILVGWEERSTAEKAATFSPLDPKGERGSIPVRTVP